MAAGKFDLPSRQAAPMGSVAATALDAARGKAAAVARGYYEDAHADAFAKPRPGFTAGGPLFNRGHFARIAAVGAVIERFLDAATPERAQVVSLGAGFDTRYWALVARRIAPRLYLEIDQPEIVDAKRAAVSRDASLLRALPGGRESIGSEEILPASGRGYALLVADLRSIPSVDAALARARWDPAAPTLLIAECVLVYLPPSASAQLLGWFRRRAESAVLVAYEQIRPDDAFSRVMLANLRQRGCPLLGLTECADEAAQVLFLLLL